MVITRLANTLRPVVPSVPSFHSVACTPTPLVSAAGDFYLNENPLESRGRRERVRAASIRKVHSRRMLISISCWKQTRPTSWLPSLFLRRTRPSSFLPRRDVRVRIIARHHCNPYTFRTALALRLLRRPFELIYEIHRSIRYSSSLFAKEHVEGYKCNSFFSDVTSCRYTKRKGKSAVAPERERDADARLSMSRYHL